MAQPSRRQSGDQGNEVPTAASDVQIEPVGFIGEGHPITFRLDEQPLSLAAGQERSFIATIALGTVRGVECSFSWRDDDGPHTERRQVFRP